jgi:hypothetical protein
MTNRFMISVAAVALIAGTSFANAQGMSREAPSGGAAVQQSAPSSERSAPSSAAPSSAAPMNRSDDAKAPAEKTTQSDQKMAPQGNKSAQDMKSGPKGEKSAQDNNTNNMKGEKSKSMSSENDNAKDNAKGNTKGATDMKAEGRNGNSTAEEKSSTDTKSQTTVGQAGAGAKLSGEQRTKITTVIRSQHVQPLANVNFSISVGTRVPRDVRFNPLPAEVVTVYPEWRGYEFVLVNNQIIVIDPRTFEIVAVIDA